MNKPKTANRSGKRPAPFASRPAASRKSGSKQADRSLCHALEVDTIGVAFFEFDGRVTWANDAFLRQSHYTREAVEAGRVNLGQLTAPVYAKNFRRECAELRAGGRTESYEKEFVRPDGTRWWAKVASARLSATEAVKFVTDESTHKKVEYELHATRQNLALHLDELQRVRAHLESNVINRTAALDALNGMLRDEVLEGQHSERERRQILHMLVNAQEEERRRISRELHDEIGQHLAVMTLCLKSIQASSPIPSNLSQSLQAVLEILEKVGQEVHDLALELRPTSLDDLGLLRTLANYVEQWKARSAVEVDFLSSGWDGNRMPPQIETHIYRIVQEALTNVMKHAAASRVSVIIERRPEDVMLIVEDNGRGFDPNGSTTARRIGLVGMKERASLLDAEFNLESAPGRGTTLFVRIPLT